MIISDSIDPNKVCQLVDSLYHSEEEGEETQVKVPKTFEERKQLGELYLTAVYVLPNAWEITSIGALFRFNICKEARLLLSVAIKVTFITYLRHMDVLSSQLVYLVIRFSVYWGFSKSALNMMQQLPRFHFYEENICLPLKPNCKWSSKQ